MEVKTINELVKIIDKACTKAEYAKEKNISRARVTQMVNEGKIKYFKIKGGMIVFLD
jgi:hypothetical protein